MVLLMLTLWKCQTGSLVVEVGLVHSAFKVISRLTYSVVEVRNNGIGKGSKTVSESYL